MTFEDMIDDLSRETGATKADTKRMVDRLITVVKRETLEKKSAVRIPGLGSFIRRDRDTSQGVVASVRFRPHGPARKLVSEKVSSSTVVPASDSSEDDMER